MSITSAQKKALQAAGYTVRGNNVTNKDGGSVGGYNKEGKIWSGSTKVRDILKSSPKEAPKAEPKETPKAKPTTKTKPKEAPTAKDGMKGYRKGDVTTSKLPSKGGSGKDIRKTVLSGLDKADKEKKKEKTSSPVPVIAAAAASAKGGSKPVGKPNNPNYKGGKGGKTGFQGKYNTSVARAGDEGRGKRRLGYAPTLSVGSGAGKPNLDDKLRNLRLK